MSLPFRWSPGSRTQNTGSAPSVAQRAAAHPGYAASRMKPVMSMRLREATSAGHGEHRRAATGLIRANVCRFYLKNGLMQAS